ncbi:MAG: nucleotidyltransferase family protein [Azoarcus sp.]|jgi:MurNAc alpha-1-phosphate uridylyltransferase|nr:nucleotidyltransferase family protein [Azoarcus sp.]
MKAMILAAGRGERMRPLTDRCPKPLLAVGGKPLIVRHIERLAAAGITDIVINHAHLGHMLEAALGDGGAFGARIRWSPEPPGALETAGGIRQAMQYLGGEPFLTINGDVFCDIDFAALAAIATRLTPQHGDLAHLLLVDNPDHHPGGDFILQNGRVRDQEISDDEVVTDPSQDARARTGGAGQASESLQNGRMRDQEKPRLTFSGIAAYHPALFAHLEAGRPARLAPQLRAAMHIDRVSGAHHRGCWLDIGTPERLARLDAELTQNRGETPSRP